MAPALPSQSGSEHEASGTEAPQLTWPAAILPTAPLVAINSFDDTAALCWAPPGGELRWHAYLSVWRN
ncbi:MAG: hypothetical protein CMJ58_08025 [Planctomycetaceae bacterium]|nr:hypothetical protein [Planctomycetaceae bacterium]